VVAAVEAIVQADYDGDMRRAVFFVVKKSDKMTSSFSKKKSYTTALAIVVTPADDVDALRKDHDKAYGRWPAHVNLLFPFVPVDEFGAAESALSQALSKNNVSFACTLKFDRIASFPHGNVHVVPVIEVRRSPSCVLSFTTLCIVAWQTGHADSHVQERTCRGLSFSNRQVSKPYASLDHTLCARCVGLNFNLTLLSVNGQKANYLRR
jgi:hypothetical protein